MQELSAQHLETVAGGASKSDQLTQSLTQIQSSIKDLASSNNNNGSSNTTTMLMLALAMQNRQPTVVAAAPSGYACGTTTSFRFRAKLRF